MKTFEEFRFSIPHDKVRKQSNEVSLDFSMLINNGIWGENDVPDEEDFQKMTYTIAKDLDPEKAKNFEFFQTANKEIMWSMSYNNDNCRSKEDAIDFLIEVTLRALSETTGIDIDIDQFDEIGERIVDLLK